MALAFAMNCPAAIAAFAPSPDAMMILLPNIFVTSPAANIPGREVDQSEPTTKVGSCKFP